MNLTISVVPAEVAVPLRVGTLPYSGVPPIRLTVSQAISRFTDWLEKGGKKANNYPRVAAQFLQLCLTHQWVIDEVAMTLYRAGRAASQGTPVRAFLHWFQVAGSPQIVADPLYHLPPIYHELIDQFLHDHVTLHSLDSKGTYIRVLNAFFNFW